MPVLPAWHLCATARTGKRQMITCVEYRPLPVVFAVGDFLALFEHVFFGLVVGNIFWR